MLREIFFGKENPKLIEERKLIDAEPREVYIIACLLLPIIGIGSFSSLGTSGAMLQMVSHGLIGASLFFLVGATYDRTKTLKLDEMSGVGQKMRIMFALWTACSLASLALPGMSGFVSELMVFTGFVTDEVYTLPFRVVMASLAAIGVILTPIYLLSMLREIFFGKENPKLIEERKLIDLSLIHI